VDKPRAASCNNMGLDGFTGMYGLVSYSLVPSVFPKYGCWGGTGRGGVVADCGISVSPEARWAQLKGRKNPGPVTSRAHCRHRSRFRTRSTALSSPIRRIAFVKKHHWLKKNDVT
jgi:hypothetical protein